MERQVANFAVSAALLLAGTSFASAHITLEKQEAAIGSGYKAVLRVPHGCKGSATVSLSVQIPAGVIAVKPQPKPGWRIDIGRGKYDQPYDYYGSKVGEGVRTITWSDGRLPDDYYDEFVFNSYLTKGLEAGGTLYFPVVQTCEEGVERWIEIPAAGKNADDYESPAPALKLLAPQGDSD
jgi:uncharacterized protein YcnI